MSIDSGIVWIGDPCYLYPNEEAPVPTAVAHIGTWQDLVRKCYGRKQHFASHSFKGFGIAVSTTDGEYPVYATFDTHGIITSVTIPFTEEEGVSQTQE